MAQQVLDYYRIKREFLPSGLQWLGVYVRPGELDLVANPKEWELVGRSINPNRLQASDVDRQGYCLSKLSCGATHSGGAVIGSPRVSDVLDLGRLAS